MCVADEYPWPITSGYRIRLAGVLEALNGLGDVDLFCTVGDRPDLPEGDIDPAHGLHRTYIHGRPTLTRSLAGFGRWVRSGWPRAVALRDWAAPAAALASFRRGPYDLAWYSHGDVWLALGASGDEPTLVDLDNLESEILRAHAEAPADAQSRFLDRARSLLRRPVDRVDAQRWARAEGRAAATSHGAIVCSSVDAARLGQARTAVIPNGYAEQAPPAAAEGPVITMAGLLVYKPNLDGARWFVREVLPRIRRRVPGASVRLIGRFDERAQPLGDVEGVALIGEVDDIAAALAGTAVIVAPLRSGSGTRIKILEAFARRYPVATTTLGCEGLGAVPGTDLLIGDTPEELATACVRLLTDPALAEDVAGAGWRIWDERYRWEVIQPRIQQLVLQAVDDASAD